MRMEAFGLEALPPAARTSARASPPSRRSGTRTSGGDEQAAGRCPDDPRGGRSPHRGLGHRARARAVARRRGPGWRGGHPGRAPPSRLRGLVPDVRRRREVWAWNDPTRTFDVSFDVTGSDPTRLRPGLTTQVLVTGAPIKAARYLPRQALFEQDGKPVVFVRQGRSFLSRARSNCLIGPKPTLSSPICRWGLKWRCGIHWPRTGEVQGSACNGAA